MTIRIGANPIGWSNDDDQTIGGDTSLETCLGEAREAGIVGMELGHKMPREAGALKAALAAYGMAFVGGWYSCELLLRSAEAEIEAMQGHLAMAKGAGAKAFIIAETSNAIHGQRAVPLSKRPHMAPGGWAEYGRRMTKVAEAVRAGGMQLVYHYHMGTIVQSRADIAAFMEHAGEAVHLVLDTGHATWGGSDPAELAKTYRHRISHVHCKDVRPAIAAKSAAGDWSFLDSILGMGDELGVYTVPGDGCIDYTAVFREMKGYDGWVVLEAEQDPKKAPALPCAKKGIAHMQKTMKEAGLV